MSILLFDVGAQTASVRAVRDAVPLQNEKLLPADPIATDSSANGGLRAQITEGFPYWRFRRAHGDFSSADGRGALQG